ncbi:MAG: hypothetical protein A2234_10360 [Elusimicrobia bacterium RIFOXYA2_FULL_58_8]|nr:MAG: hypothetical protein A2285_04315 [Elusimicrobia bacterium RIFOXYA12_FULL_57_11]OGS14574.1 MAG: hypothetical protein A2234_10360 [Elusimicrobia bacterium RIFOXYA2_FULL_58_8]
MISAVELERFAVVPPLAWGGLAALPPAQQLPIPKSVPAFRASAAPAAWILAVKKAYLSCPQGALPPAMAAELPLAAAQQMQWDSSTYPSKAYKIVLDGRAAFVIENDNFDALYVNIFDEAGAHIAYGGFDENYDFYWLTKNSR